MRILADENLDSPVVIWLREQGHDVLAMAEVDPGRSDLSVLTLASAESRVLITNDLDYGGLVFRRGRATRGLVLLRLRAASPEVLLSQRGHARSPIVTGVPALSSRRGRQILPRIGRSGLPLLAALRAAGRLRRLLAQNLRAARGISTSVAHFQQHWPIIEREAPGHFLVVKNRRVRIRPLPA